MKKFTVFIFCLLSTEVALGQLKNQIQRYTKADSLMLGLKPRPNLTPNKPVTYSAVTAKTPPPPVIAVAPAPVINTANTGVMVKPADSTFVPVVDVPVSYAQNISYKRRLDSIKKEVPLDYNDYVQTYIDIYTGPHRKDEMARIIGRAKYYFPIYEKAFRDAGIPEEIKFLSIVESALNPYAVSRVGATGPWQFMFTTAKLYGLNIDNYIDERRDPIQATYAAAAYIKDAYQDFGDWLVAIASYNCGKGSVTRAIQKAGASDFWSIRRYLPVETRNYVPAYIAIAYVMNYYQKHDIVPQECDFSVKTDTVLVNKYVSLAEISSVSHIEMNQLSSLNPQYKKLIINGTPATPRRLVIPQIDKSSYSALYDALNTHGAGANFEPVKASSVDYAISKKKKPATVHKVKRGENLASIADEYAVEVQDLKVWNHLTNLKIKPGQILKVSDSGSSAEKYAEPRHLSSKNYITYKVRPGDTLSQIAEKFNGVSVETIKSINGLKNGRIVPGMTLKISKS